MRDDLRSMLRRMREDEWWSPGTLAEALEADQLVRAGELVERMFGSQRKYRLAKA